MVDKRKKKNKSCTTSLARRLIGNTPKQLVGQQQRVRVTEEMNEFTTHHGYAPMFRCFGDRIGDRIAGSAEDHDFAGILVHHVEKGFHADRGAAL